MLLKKCCKESYTISEFMQLDNQDLSLIDRFLGNLKKNKKEYAKLVFLLAVFLNNNNNIYAESLEAGLGTAASEIIHMVLIFGKYGCLGMGIKSMIEEMLQGANIKEATGAGLQYFIFYIVLQLYPKLFSMIKF